MKWDAICHFFLKLQLDVLFILVAFGECGQGIPDYVSDDANPQSSRNVLGPPEDLFGTQNLSAYIPKDEKLSINEDLQGEGNQSLTPSNVLENEPEQHSYLMLRRSQYKAHAKDVYTSWRKGNYGDNKIYTNNTLILEEGDKYLLPLEQVPIATERHPIRNVTPVIFGDMLLIKGDQFIPIEYLAEVPTGGIEYVIVLGPANEYLGGYLMQKAIPWMFTQSVIGTPFVQNGVRYVPVVKAEYSYLRHRRKYTINMMPEIIYLAQAFYDPKNVVEVSYVMGDTYNGSLLVPMTKTIIGANGPYMMYKSFIPETEYSKLAHNEKHRDKRMQSVLTYGNPIQVNNAMYIPTEKIVYGPLGPMTIRNSYTTLQEYEAKKNKEKRKDFIFEMIGLPTITNTTDDTYYPMKKNVYGFNGPVMEIRMNLTKANAEARFGGALPAAKGKAQWIYFRTPEIVNGIRQRRLEKIDFKITDTWSIATVIVPEAEFREPIDRLLEVGVLPSDELEEPIKSLEVWKLIDVLSQHGVPLILKNSRREAKETHKDTWKVCYTAPFAEYGHATVYLKFDQVGHEVETRIFYEYPEEEFKARLPFYDRTKGCFKPSRRPAPGAHSKPAAAPNTQPMMPTHFNLLDNAAQQPTSGVSTPRTEEQNVFGGSHPIANDAGSSDLKEYNQQAYINKVNENLSAKAELVNEYPKPELQNNPVENKNGEYRTENSVVHNLECMPGERWIVDGCKNCQCTINGKAQCSDLKCYQFRPLFGIQPPRGANFLPPPGYYHPNPASMQPLRRVPNMGVNFAPPLPGIIPNGNPQLVGPVRGNIYDAYDSLYDYNLYGTRANFIEPKQPSNSIHNTEDG